MILPADTRTNAAVKLPMFRFGRVRKMTSLGFEMSDHDFVMGFILG